MILLAAMTAIAALMLAATPALAQSQGFGGDDERKVTICHFPPGNPDNEHTISVGASAVPAHLAHGDYRGECKDDGNGNGNGNGNGDGRDNDRDFRDFCRIFDCRDNDNNGVVPAFEITQDFEQEAESGDIDQSFDVSQTGDNSNQTVGIQGVANTGNAQTQLGVIDAGGFGDFDGNNDDERVFFVDDFCDFDSDGDGICDRLDRLQDRFEDLCQDGEVDEDNDGICDRLDDRIDRLEDRINDGVFFVVEDDDNDRFFGNNDGSDFEFEDVGSTIEVSPTNTVSSDQQVNQAATAFGK